MFLALSVATVGLRLNSPLAARGTLGVSRRSLCKMSADEDAIKTLINEIATDKTGIAWKENAEPGALFIRPSGNPIAAADFATFLSTDVKIDEAALVKLHKLDVGTDMAFAALTRERSRNQRAPCFARALNAPWMKIFAC